MRLVHITFPSPGAPHVSFPLGTLCARIPQKPQPTAFTVNQSCFANGSKGATMNALRMEYPITNRYTFAKVFSNPDNVRPLLEGILGVPIGKIRMVEPEHSVEPSLRGRGVRMDVFVEDQAGTVYDVEMQNANEGNLELRSRYLLSSFDRDRIMRGEDYIDLGHSIVIFVCDFDPIGLGDRMYVIKPAVVDHWHVFDDGTTRIFLNAKGASGESVAPSLADKPRIASFLSYVDGGDTMGDEWVEDLDKQVRALNADVGWRQTVLGLQLEFEHARHLAQKEGHAMGVAEGREAGLAEGREAGLAEGREAGLAEGREAGLAEGREAGLAEGRIEADRIDAELVDALSAAGRLDELADALRSPEKKTQLLMEFDIS